MNDKICELEKQIEQMKNELETLRKKVKQEIHIGFEDDPIFLLSKEEYERYENQIPEIHSMWWLRSPGSCRHVAVCDRDGSVDCNGYLVNDPSYFTVRPVVDMAKLNRAKYNEIVRKCKAFRVEDRFIALGATWTIIDKEKGLAIAEMPIMFSRFDEKSNDYKKSEVRKKLLDWYKERVEW